jgi:hypothetical protein
MLQKGDITKVCVTILKFPLYKDAKLIPLAHTCT